jgi:hypothetical protein
MAKRKRLTVPSQGNISLSVIGGAILDHSSGGIVLSRAA